MKKIFFALILVLFLLSCEKSQHDLEVKKLTISELLYGIADGGDLFDEKVSIGSLILGEDRRLDISSVGDALFPERGEMPRLSYEQSIDSIGTLYKRNKKQ